MRISLLLPILCTAPVLGQVASYPEVRRPESADSGYLSNPRAVDAVLWTRDFTIPYASFLQLHFRDTNLPEGSRLKIYAPSNAQWAQWHDARSLADYQWFSCQFEGPTARAELHAGPGTSGNRVLIDEVRGLLVGQPLTGDSICGSSDDRVLSNDPRACRQDASCSAWLFSPYAVSTAGHCFSSTAGHILHFNVPLSSPSGSPRPSAPNDQYAMEAFRIGMSAGVGADYNVAAAVRNSNTGLFPGQAQGSWYDVVAPSNTISGDIRITGYGTGNGTTGSPTANQAQKTHAGPRVSTSTANAVSYRTDTTGGNSGSPVIYEPAGQVVGVHTHGGCTSSGGRNSGTSAGRSDYANARAAALSLHVVGEFRNFGTGCGAAAGIPLLNGSGIPELGRTVTLRVTNLNPSGNAFGALLLGYASQPSPVDLSPYGLQGCTLYVTTDASIPTTTLFGQAFVSLAIPNVPAFVSMQVFFQHFATDPTAGNALHGVMSNAAELTVGS